MWRRGGRGLARARWLTHGVRATCVLQNYQFKIQQKQKFLDEMAEILRKLDQPVPNTDIDAEAEEFIWDDEERNDDDYYVEYYTGDDDWMSDEEWY